MEFDFKDLKLRITKIFDTQPAFAKAMGMCYTALNFRLNNKTEWKASEIFKACQLLGIPLEKLGMYFFKLKVEETKQE